MLKLVIVGLVCLFIGWNVPQPPWAVKFQAWVVKKYNDLKARFSKSE